MYPATLSSYTTSQAAGVQAMNTLVNNYAARCPNSKIVLMVSWRDFSLETESLTLTLTCV